MQQQTLYPTASPQWFRYTLSYTDLQTAALTNSINFYLLPANALIHDAKIQVTQAFAGTTTLTLSLGIAGTLAKFITAASALATGTLGSVLTTSDLESSSAATNIQLTAVATVQNLSSLTQGTAVVYILASQLQ